MDGEVDGTRAARWTIVMILPAESIGIKEVVF
jgi:hypothetical protein